MSAEGCVVQQWNVV